MLTEFEVRQKVETIAASDATPERKARMLLRLGRSLKAQALSLSHARNQAVQATDKNATEQLERMARTNRMLYDDVRSSALSFMRPRRSLRANVSLN